MGRRLPVPEGGRFNATEMLAARAMQAMPRLFIAVTRRIASISAPTAVLTAMARAVVANAGHANALEASLRTSEAMRTGHGRVEALSSTTTGEARRSNGRVRVRVRMRVCVNSPSEGRQNCLRGRCAKIRVLVAAPLW